MVRQCLWKMSATTGACMHQTGFSSAAVMPQSKFTELTVARRPFCHGRYVFSFIYQDNLPHVNLITVNLPS